jgi:hypothetical protein
MEYGYSMEDYVIKDELLDKVRDQFKLWAMFLNNGVGLLSFSLGLASLGTNIPWVSAILSIVVVILIRNQGKHYFPSEIKKLRDIAKNEEKARILLKGLEAEYFSNKKMIKEYPLFLIGFVFLMSVALSPMFLGFYGSINLFYGN